MDEIGWKSMSPQKIGRLRKQIDRIDHQILDLLAQRSRRVTQVGEIKRTLQAKFYVPEREEKILASLIRENKSLYKSQAIQTIFREILSASLALESPLKIAYLGPEATFTHQAAIKRFGKSAQFVAQPSIQKVFQEVGLNRADYGIVPIENSTEGVVGYTLDLFVEHALKICGEVKLLVTQNLLSTAKDFSQIKKVYSHPQALAQCRLWLDSHLPFVKTGEVSSTSRAAEIAKLEGGSAAISSQYAAHLYGLPILAQHIEDRANNYTRFVVIGNNACGPTGRDKTSIIVSAKDEVGALYHLLAPLAHEKINLTKIESRPLKGRAWEYIFFIDMEGHQEEPPMKKALHAIEKRSSFLKVLGSYPKGN